MVDWTGWHLRFRLAATQESAAVVEKTELTASAAFSFLAGNAQFVALTDTESAALSAARGSYWFEVFLQSPAGRWSAVAAGRVAVLRGLPAAA